MQVKTKPEIEINWLINDFCNFSCTYCYPGLRKNEFSGIRDIQTIVDGFDRIGPELLIYISGGEPFLFPSFVELCDKLTQRHTISMNTNLAHKDVIRFAENINPEKVRCVHCSMHIQERERLGLIQDFIQKYKLLEGKGFYVFASYVLYPPLMKRFKEDYEYFKSQGIILRPKVFRGLYYRFEGQNFRIPRLVRRVINCLSPKLYSNIFVRRYPEAYSKDEKEMILYYINKSQEDGSFNINHEHDIEDGRLSDVYLDQFFVDGFPSFKGSFCLAGKNFFRMTPEGEVYRCYDEKRYLGNLFEGDITVFKEPAKCVSEACSCPYMGYRYALKENRKLRMNELSEYSPVGGNGR